MGTIRRVRCLPPRRWSRQSLALLSAVIMLSSVSGISIDRVEAASNWDRFDASLASVAPSVGFLAAEVIDGACEPVHAYQADRRMAIASTFKLYVLAELARQVLAGEIAWDERLTIRDELRSMPSGDTAFDPAGARRTIEDLALRMIRDSDNTATDHLITRLGRERVEAAFGLFGHQAPDVNVPLLLTRELFAFKMHVDPSLVEEYIAAPADLRREILVDSIDPLVLNPRNWGHWTGPAWINEIEWIASPTEVCDVLAHLHAMADDPALRPVRRILGSNRGGVFERGTWPFSAFKGGYEAGVINATWLLERADGRTLVVTAAFNDPAAYINQGAVYGALPGAATLLARTP